MASVLRVDIADGVFLRGIGRGEKLADVLVKIGDVAVVLLDLAGEFGIGGQHLPDFDESAHDGHVYFNGPVAVENSGKHGYALFGEGVRGRSPGRPSLRAQFATSRF